MSRADATPHRRLRRRVLSRSAFFAATSALVAWAALVVPMPVVEVVPGEPRPIEPLVTIEGVDVTELSGTTAILTVSNQRPPPLTTLTAFLDRDRDLTPYHEVYPPGIDRREFLRGERERFSRQFDVAAAIGATAAGADTVLVTEVVVVEVLPGSPADGVLLPGDVVKTADGEELTAAEQLQHLTREAAVGDELHLTVRRNGEVLELVAELDDVTGEGDVRLGVGIETAVDDVELPFEISLVEGIGIGGPSAGLMVALTVFDLLSDEDLLGHRTVVGTGTLDADGRVGPVGGIPEKMQAAAAFGADVVLVPQLQLDAAREAAPDGLSIIGVATLDEALDALRREAI